jgi:hypothetical protein
MGGFGSSVHSLEAHLPLALIWAVGLGSSVLVGGCGPGHTEFHALPTVELLGRLGGERINDGLTNCVWIVGPNGDRTYLFLPDAVRVESKPLRLIDSAGSVIAREGESVTVKGPSGTVGETSCAPGEVPFEVETIVASRLTVEPSSGGPSARQTSPPRS